MNDKLECLDMCVENIESGCKTPSKKKQSKKEEEKKLHDFVT
jgi:hypothetical protein